MRLLNIALQHSKSKKYEGKSFYFRAVRSTLSDGSLLQESGTLLRHNVPRQLNRCPHGTSGQKTGRACFRLCNIIAGLSNY